MLFSKVKIMNIELKNIILIEKNYITTVKQTSYTFKQGHIYLIANNGDITSLLKTIAGMRKPDSGNIIYSQKLNRLKDVSYLSFEPVVCSLFSVKENIYRAESSFFHNLFISFNLDSKKDFRYFTDLEKIKLMLIRELSKKPKILILDSVFDVLDELSYQALCQYILQLKKIGSTIIIGYKNYIPKINTSEQLEFKGGKLYAKNHKRISA